MLEKPSLQKSGYFQGFFRLAFSNPPFCAPTLCHPSKKCPIKDSEEQLPPKLPVTKAPIPKPGFRKHGFGHPAGRTKLGWPHFRDAPDTFNFLRHVMRAIWSVRPKCSHRFVSLKETPLKLVQILKHTTFYSAEQTAMRTKWFKHIAI